MAGPQFPLGEKPQAGAGGGYIPLLLTTHLGAFSSLSLCLYFLFGRFDIVCLFLCLLTFIGGFCVFVGFFVRSVLGFLCNNKGPVLSPSK